MTLRFHGGPLDGQTRTLDFPGAWTLLPIDGRESHCWENRSDGTAHYLGIYLPFAAPYR